MAEDQTHAAAQRLLDRAADAQYLEEWTQLLQKQRQQEGGINDVSVVIFRIQGEWLALPTALFSQIAHPRPIHRIPHHTGLILKGTVNLRGQLKLCIALDKLLEIEPIPATESSGKIYQRMIEIKRKDESWVFPIDEVYGIFRFSQMDLKNVPVTVAKSTANYLKGVITWESKSVGYLDADLLFSSLTRSAL